MKYDVYIAKEANKDIAKLRFSEPKAHKKLMELVAELHEHPEMGTGHPKHFDENRWSRRITQKHHLVYRIKEDEQTVIVLSAYGHYDDK
jgi:toxin YoeB